MDTGMILSYFVITNLNMRNNYLHFISKCFEVNIHFKYEKKEMTERYDLNYPNSLYPQIS